MLSNLPNVASIVLRDSFNGATSEQRLVDALDALKALPKLHTIHLEHQAEWWSNDADDEVGVHQDFGIDQCCINQRAAQAISMLPRVSCMVLPIGTWSLAGLQHLVKLGQLKRLSIHGIDIEEMQALEGMTQLVSLTLELSMALDLDIQDMLAEQLRKAVLHKFTNLQYLSVKHLANPSDSRNSLQLIQLSSRLKCIFLEFNAAEDEPDYITFFHNHDHNNVTTSLGYDALQCSSRHLVGSCLASTNGLTGARVKQQLQLSAKIMTELPSWSSASSDVGADDDGSGGEDGSSMTSSGGNNVSTCMVQLLESLEMPEDALQSISALSITGLVDGHEDAKLCLHEFPHLTSLHLQVRTGHFNQVF